MQLGRERELGFHRPEIIEGRGLLRFQDELLNRLDPLGEGAVENILVADLGENPGQGLALLDCSRVCALWLLHRGFNRIFNGWIGRWRTLLHGILSVWHPA